MAYMNQERKARIAKALKLAIPASWKYSLAVRHHSTIVLTIAAAPVDLLGQMKARSAREAIEHNHQDYLVDATHASLNPYHWRAHSDFDAETAAIFEAVFAALNDGNHDRSDPMTDYFDVGWYVDVTLGKWNKPFAYTGAKAAQAVHA